MAIKAGKVMRTATAAARKIQLKQFSATQSASSATPPVTPSSGVGTFMGIPQLPRSDTDVLISTYFKLYQNRLTKKGAFSEENLKKMFTGSGQVFGIKETMNLLEGKTVVGESSKKPINIRSINNSRKKK